MKSARDRISHRACTDSGSKGCSNLQPSERKLNKRFRTALFSSNTSLSLFGVIESLSSPLISIKAPVVNNHSIINTRLGFLKFKAKKSMEISKTFMKNLSTKNNFKSWGATGFEHGTLRCWSKDSLIRVTDVQRSIHILDISLKRRASLRITVYSSRHTAFLELEPSRFCKMDPLVLSSPIMPVRLLVIDIYRHTYPC